MNRSASVRNVTTRLAEIETTEVSLVARGKNGKRLALAKGETMGALGVDEVKKALVEINEECKLPEAVAKQLEEQLAKATMDDAAKDAVRAALKLLSAAGDAVPEDLKRQLAGLVGYGYPAPETKSAEAKPSNPLPTDLLKEDGTPNEVAINALPEAQRPGVQALAKELAANRRRLADAEAVVKEEREARRSREWAEKTGQLVAVGTHAEMAKLLKSIDDRDPALAAQVLATLAKADTLLKASKAFDELGTGGGSGGGAGPMARLETLAKEMADKSGGKVTKEGAFAFVLDSPEGKRLYSEYLSERG